MRLAIDIRPPSQQQQKDNGWDATHFRHPVATVVLRNVSTHRCRGGSGVFYFRILDQVGKVIGAWNSGYWFRHPYRPGGYRTFSLPAVYHCAQGRSPPSRGWVSTPLAATTWGSATSRANDRRDTGGLMNPGGASLVAIGMLWSSDKHADSKFVEPSGMG
jgi:hypothetical protein